MKKIFIVFSLLICRCSGLSAQSVTINALPKNPVGVHMDLVMDFSQAVIYGMSEEEFAAYEEDWYKDKPSIMDKFRTGANVILGDAYKIGHYKDISYTVKVTVHTITDEGYIICDVDIIDRQGQSVFHIDHLTGGKEPSFFIGTKLARIKIWAALTGKNYGSILKDASVR